MPLRNAQHVVAVMADAPRAPVLGEKRVRSEGPCNSASEPQPQPHPPGDEASAAAAPRSQSLRFAAAAEAALARVDASARAGARDAAIEIESSDDDVECLGSSVPSGSEARGVSQLKGSTPSSSAPPSAPAAPAAPTVSVTDFFNAAKASVGKAAAAKEARERAALDDANKRLADRAITIRQGAMVKDRGSVFVPHVAVGGAVTCMEDVYALACVVRASVGAGAAHPCIYAYTLPDGDSGFDDDGETHAGKRILTAIVDRRGRRSGCFVAVTRWFGGVLLGPARFTHIARCAHDALTLAEAGVV